MKMKHTSTNSPASSLGSETNARRWFTELLTEGWCVGICTDRSDASATSNNGEESIINSTSLLHPDEYLWGQNNITSDSSRASYYLGRMALRLSLNGLLERERGAMVTNNTLLTCYPEEVTNGVTHAESKRLDNPFFNQLYDQIQNTAIIKDYHGRPILPEIILGSISHKGENAVGLARFRCVTWNNPNKIWEGLNVGEDVNGFGEGVVKWTEERPIFDDNVTKDVICSDSPSKSLIASQHIRGVGIDLERIDGRRGKRIERRVLTEKEQEQLGGLEEIGISREEEVLLRFSLNMRSLKESVYKAMHPIICQYVGFQEAEITPFPNATAQVILNLTSRSHEHLGIVVQSASWKIMDDFFVTSASAGVTKDCGL